MSEATTPAEPSAPDSAPRRCSACGRENDQRARFCDTCGTRLDLLGARTAVPTPTSLGGGRYQITATIGEGLRKVVYRAFDTVLDREVALAVLRADELDDAERARVEREVRLLARLGSHPHIVTVYDFEELDGTPTIVFELLPRGSLRDLLQAIGGRGLPVGDVLRIGEQTAWGLDACHREQVVFRDLKPGNVLLTGDGTAKLCDFGYALRIGQHRLTDEQLVVGSLAYLAPERIARRHYDHRSDLYALGVLLYELLCGHPPFDGDDVQAVGSQHLHADPPPVRDVRSDVPDALVTLVDRLLAKEVADRPGSAAEVAHELARLRTARTSG